MQSKQKWTQEYLKTTDDSLLILSSLTDHSGKTIVIPEDLRITFEGIQSFLNQQKYEGPVTERRGPGNALSRLRKQLKDFPQPQSEGVYQGKYSVEELWRYLEDNSAMLEGSQLEDQPLDQPLSLGKSEVRNPSPNVLEQARGPTANCRVILNQLLSGIGEECGELTPKYLGGSDNLSEDSRLALEGLLETVEVEWQQFDATQAVGDASSSARLERTETRPAVGSPAQPVSGPAAGGAFSSVGLERTLAHAAGGSSAQPVSGAVVPLDVDPSLAHYSKESNTLGKVLSFLLGLFVFAACAGIGAFVGGAGASVTSVATLGAFIVGDGALFVGIGSAIGLVAGCMAGKYTWPRSGDVSSEQMPLLKKQVTNPLSSVPKREESPREQQPTAGPEQRERVGSSSPSSSQSPTPGGGSE